MIARQDWETPDDKFMEWDKEFGFTLDVAASHSNHKCDHYYTEADNGIIQPWWGVVWCNPPYGKIAPWIYKAMEEQKRGVTTVMLVPTNRSDQQWWADAWPHVEPRWIRGRVKFKGAVASPPFACCLLIFRGEPCENLCAECGRWMSDPHDLAMGAHSECIGRYDP